MKLALEARVPRYFNGCLAVVSFLLLPLPATGQLQQTLSVPGVPASEYAERRARMLPHLQGGILLLHARAAEKEMEQWGFIQDPAFLYFTGLPNLPMAVFALDGVSGESHLFVPPPPTSFGMPVEGVVPTPSAAAELGLHGIHPWNDLKEWVERRAQDGVKRLYVNQPRRPIAPGLPDAFRRVSGHLDLWNDALGDVFPTLEVTSVKDALRDQRWVKSTAEVAALRANAKATASALLAVAAVLKSGTTQRNAEATVVAGCLDAGAQGPSFWPWVMSGPNAATPRLVASFYRYDNLNRVMQNGEVVRVDIGCAGGFYGGDVGRTLPVSGAFDEGQAEAWNLLVHGYQAGLAAMRPGVPLDEVRDVSVAAIAEARADLKTPQGREAADALLEAGRSAWHIHGVGIESGEDPGARLEAGSVLAYEPGVQVGADAFYLEDMILITADGHEVLSSGLPYTAGEIAAVMGPSN